MININILYEDSDILVLDKPSGVIVNKADTTKNEITVQDFLESIYNFKNEIEDESDFCKRAGIVHRIDKETSGILIAAKNKESFLNLQSQFKERKVEKTYIALVHGNVKLDNGEISAPVGRLPWNRKRFGVMAGGKDAQTFYKVIERFGNLYTLLELYPKTGRTHQIRVHLKYFNHPIFGDEFYAGRKTSRLDRKFLNRFFLHAKKISFFHPKTGKRVEFQSQLPRELKNTVDALSIDTGLKN